jgi:hypothetical protein
MTVSGLGNLDGPKDEVGKVRNTRVSYKIYNGQSKVQLAGDKNLVDGNLIIDIESIPDGTYFLHSIRNKKVIKRQIIVRH